MRKEQIENTPTVKLELTLGHEEAIFTVLYDYLSFGHRTYDEVLGIQPPELTKKVKNLRSLMPKLAKDINYNIKESGRGPLELMNLGFFDYVQIEELQKIYEENKKSYETDRKRKENKGNFWPLSRVIMDTADYFIKQKLSTTKK
jgi:hypothetical protein